MNRPKYLIFGNGESSHLFKWVSELIKHYDVYILSPLGVHEKIKELIPAENIFSLHMPLRPEGGNAKMLMKVFTFRRIIKKLNPNVVNAHYVTSHGFISAILKKIFGLKYLLIQSAWGTDILVTPGKNFLYKFITKYSLNASDLITSDSEYMSSFIRKLSRMDCLTFPFGIDKMPELRIEEKDPDLFFSNRALTNNYNIDRVIHVFLRIVKENEKARLIISNDGELRKDLEDLVAKMNLNHAISFKGFLNAEEQAKIYRKASYFMSLPSSDSTSVSLLEAMAYGCVPLLSDLPANKEWVKNGVNGIIYSSEDDSNLNSIDLTFAFNENRAVIENKAIFSKSISGLIDNIDRKLLKM